MVSPQTREPVSRRRFLGSAAALGSVALASRTAANLDAQDRSADLNLAVIGTARRASCC